MMDPWFVVFEPTDGSWQQAEQCLSLDSRGIDMRCLLSVYAYRNKVCNYHLKYNKYEQQVPQALHSTVLVKSHLMSIVSLDLAFVGVGG